MANYISNPSVGQGSIGYVEAGYVYEHSMTPAYIRNASGHFAGPTSINVSVGLQARHAEPRPDPEPDGRLQRTRGERVPAGQLQLPDHADQRHRSRRRARCSAKWIIYIACAGQREAAPLGYSPLPPNLVQAVFSAVQADPRRAGHRRR